MSEVPLYPVGGRVDKSRPLKERIFILSTVLGRLLRTRGLHNTKTPALHFPLWRLWLRGGAERGHASECTSRTVSRRFGSWPSCLETRSSTLKPGAVEKGGITHARSPRLQHLQCSHGDNAGELCMAKPRTSNPTLTPRAAQNAGGLSAHRPTTPAPHSCVGGLGDRPSTLCRRLLLWGRATGGSSPNCAGSPSPLSHRACCVCQSRAWRENIYSRAQRPSVHSLPMSAGLYLEVKELRISKRLRVSFRRSSTPDFMLTPLQTCPRRRLPMLASPDSMTEKRNRFRADHDSLAGAWSGSTLSSERKVRRRCSRRLMQQVLRAASVVRASRAPEQAWGRRQK